MKIAMIDPSLFTPRYDDGLCESVAARGHEVTLLGRPMREAIGGGKALIPSNVKVGAVGTHIDVPIGHKDDVWSFDHFDTITVAVDDAPRADEIVIALVLADGGRPLPRCGSKPL